MATLDYRTTCELNKPVKIKRIDGLFFSQDVQANRIVVSVVRNGVNESITGTISANIIRADGETVVQAGEIDGNIASVKMPAAAYAVPGAIAIFVKLIQNGATSTIAAVTGYVYKSTTDVIVDPGTILPSIQDLLDSIDEATANFEESVADLAEDIDEAIAKIPQDYQDLEDDVSNLKNEIDDKQDAPASGAAAGKVLGLNNSLQPVWMNQSGGGGANVGIANVADYGAVGDGVTDDSQAIQDAVDANYDVYFESDKTYYLGSAVQIDHDICLHGGENTVIMTKTPTGGTVNDGIVVSGTLKKTTTLTTDYSSAGSTDNSGSQFTLSDMTDIEIGDVMIVTATDQYYSYARQYYYLGAVLLISDIYNGHIYTSTSMPFDITNTANVSVKIYHAPTAIIENLNFKSDLNSLGSYKYLVTFDKCKNSIIRNCKLSEMANGVNINNCVNTLADGVTVAKSKYSESVSGDGYGICINSSTSTTIRRVVAICSQGCVDLGGTIPCIDTFVYNCHLSSESRSIGIDMHENSYNIVIEDCTLAGLSLFGTATVNRCRFIKSNRNSDNNLITLRGNHDPNRSKFRLSNCTFYGNDCAVMVRPTSPQSPIQSFQNIFGLIEIENCENGYLAYNDSTSSTITANVVEELIIKNWKNCLYIYHTAGNIIKKLSVKDSSFASYNILSDGVSAHGVYTDYIYDMDFQNSTPIVHKITASKPTMGEKYVLPENVSLQLSSDNSSAKFIVCGSNLVSDDVQDYNVGTVTGSVGNALNRTIVSEAHAYISADSNGNILYTNPPNGTSKYAVFPVAMFYVKEPSKITMTATLKNTGETEGATWYPYISIVDAKTGLVSYRGNGTSKQASVQGELITHTRDIVQPSIVMCYFSVTTVVNSSVTKFEDFKISVVENLAPAVETDEPYTAHRLTGDGSLQSFAGINNIMSSESTFNLKFGADLINNPIGLLANGQGVNF